jgi:hypothetical protein
MNSVYVVFGANVCFDTNTYEHTIISMRSLECDAMDDTQKFKNVFDDVFYRKLFTEEVINFSL